MKSLRFHEVRKINSDKFAGAIRIFVEAFPPSARQPLEILRKRISTKETLLVGVLNRKIVVSFALLWKLKWTSYVLLDYFAVKKEYRRKGIGKAFLRYLRSLLRLEGKRLIIEVDDPTFGRNREEKRRRVSFYRDCGARELAGIKYYLRSLSGSRPNRLILMMLPARRGSTLKKAFVKGLIIKIYNELYTLNFSSPMVGKTIATIPDIIRLE